MRAVCLPFVLSVAACAAAPPREIADARSKIAEAERSDAATFDAAGVALAKDTLRRAERAYTDEGDSTAARGLAYVAARQADLAMTRATTEVAQQKGDEHQRELAANPTAAKLLDQELLARQGQDLLTLDGALAPRPPRDHDAELRMKDALNRLASIASVRDEPRGMVVTLPSDALFEPACALLLGVGQEHLNGVARALRQDPSARIRIEGHTDLDGTEVQRFALSSARAIAIANYLAARGVSPERITPVGRGATDFVADNRTPEGRAQNRRIEIVVETSATLASR